MYTGMYLHDDWNESFCACCYVVVICFPPIELCCLHAPDCVEGVRTPKLRIESDSSNSKKKQSHFSTIAHIHSLQRLCSIHPGTNGAPLSTHSGKPAAMSPSTQRVRHTIVVSALRILYFLTWSHHRTLATHQIHTHHNSRSLASRGRRIARLPRAPFRPLVARLDCCSRAHCASRRPRSSSAARPAGCSSLNTRSLPAAS